jgi:hypothetical protein
MPLSEESVLAHLKKVAGDDSKEPWSEDNIPYFFQKFRPDGDRIELALSFLPNASSCVERLLAVYRAAKHADWARDLYFVVRHPETAEESEIIGIGRRFLANLRALCAIIGDPGCSTYLATVTTVQVVPIAKLDRNCDDHLGVHETIGDFLRCHPDFDGPLRFLDEAYYTIACDYDLTFYLQWPHFEHICPVDCFEPYFQLWKHGYSHAFYGSTLNLAKA